MLPPMKLLDWININNLNWSMLSLNPNAIHLLDEDTTNNINYYLIKSNPHIECFKNNIKSTINRHNRNNLIKMKRINWFYMSANSNNIKLLRENLNKIDWVILSSNPNAIELLKENKDKINWCYLSRNPNAIELLKENQDKIDWFMLSINPAIFTYNYEKMRKLNIDLKTEILAVALHPTRLFKLMDIYGREETYKAYFDY